MHTTDAFPALTNAELDAIKVRLATLKRLLANQHLLPSNMYVALALLDFCKSWPTLEVDIERLLHGLEERP